MYSGELATFRTSSWPSLDQRRYGAGPTPQTFLDDEPARQLVVHLGLGRVVHHVGLGREQLALHVVQVVEEIASRVRRAAGYFGVRAALDEELEVSRRPR